MSELKLDHLSRETEERIREDRRRHWENPFSAREEDALRRNPRRDGSTLQRPAFVRDCEKILHAPTYNRYSDKTQVFSLYKNDDITRRALHVQLVSRVARNIGSLLGLNTDLIEAIALGHDIGHTPFGHAGERFLDELMREHGQGTFQHNVHSVRVLDALFKRNLTLQTLDGILCHNGEFEKREYRPGPLGDFDRLDRQVARCAADSRAAETLVPCTLEGCVVRITDIIAYLGKDRQDARKAHLLGEDEHFTSGPLGVENAEIINNLVVSIVENSYGQDYIAMDPRLFDALKLAKRENGEKIYQNVRVKRLYDETIRPMFWELFDRLLRDVKAGDRESIIWRHHVDYVEENRRHYYEGPSYSLEPPCRIVADYIASMTDDYFLDLYGELFPGSARRVEYVSYFEQKEQGK